MDLDWKTIVLGLTALSALVQWIVTFKFRRQDQTWVETMKGEIRRDVEENLKTHESRLRMQADLRLRMHDRSWGLLRDFLAASWKMHGVLRDLAVNAGGGTGFGPGLDEATESMIVLAAMATTLPPESLDMKAPLDDFRLCINRCVALVTSETIRGPDRGLAVKAITDDAASAMARIQQNAREWNKSLWDDSKSVSGLAPSPQA
jgi:hypothetical protein